MRAIICGPATYKYKDWYFEIHSYMGPHPLFKNGNPKTHVPPAFWDMWDEFKDLPDREKYRDGGIGGCKIIG